MTEKFESLVDEAILKGFDFVYEGHFTNESTWEIPKRFKENGFEINMIFFGLASTGISELRVIDRTKEGGHYVDPKTVASNFFGNMEKLNTHFSIFNNLQIVDTSETEHKVLCVMMDGEVKSAIPSILLPNWFKSNLPAIFKIIKDLN